MTQLQVTLRNNQLLHIGPFFGPTHCFFPQWKWNAYSSCT